MSETSPRYGDPPAEVEFWYEFASTYSYPTAMRIEAAAGKLEVPVRWRPFLLGPIFAAQGWKDSPFNLYPAKGRYMWRDLERICVAEGLTLREPVRFPQNGLLAARLAVLGEDDEWTPAFSRRVYLANFAEQRDISDPDVLQAILADIGLDAVSLLAQAGAASTKEAVRRSTDEAIARGIFGAPSFTVGSELFWGNDRLEAALAWADNPRRFYTAR